MKIKKVLFLTPRGSDKYLGGVEKHVKILSEKLREKGIGVGELSIDRMTKLRAWKYLWDYRKEILSSDIIHVHDVFWWYSPFRFLFFWKPIFITFHGWEGVYPPSRSAILQKKLADVLCRGTIGVGKYLEKWYGIKATFITYGVFISNRQPSSRIRHECTNGNLRKMVVFLGRLEEVNGVEVVLKTGIKMTFIGDGSYRKKCEEYGKVTGMVENVNQYLEKADLVIASSYLSIMEAMAMGKPVIAIANNPLKWDYLNCYPMAERIKIVETADQLANLLRSDLAILPGKFKGQTSPALWVMKQTPEKLAELYLKLWKK